MEQDEDDQNEEKEDGKEETELDREMGDGRDPNEQIVDEKLWNDESEDDGDNGDSEDEKFERDAPLAGPPEEDELRAKDESADNKKKNKK